jgi:hypothetical protein
MSPYHAVASVDRQSAEDLQSGSEHVVEVERKVHQHLRFAREHHRGVRTEHEFFGHACDAIDGIAELPVDQFVGTRVPT